MMIDLQQSRHQSHAEGTSEAKVNKNFEDCIELREIFIARAHHYPSYTAQGATKTTRLSPTCVSLRMHSASDAFLSCCIYNEEREIFAGA
jgi:hypothetical protein